MFVERIDHGVRCDEDPALVEELVEKQIPLTVCPLSNLKLCVVEDLREHNFARLLRKGVAVTINSDDPAYFGGYIGENYRQTARALDLTPASSSRAPRTRSTRRSCRRPEVVADQRDPARGAAA